jgi:hypothetical protein
MLRFSRPHSPKSSSLKSGALTLALACSLPVAGCGTGEYNDRMEARAQELQFTGNFESNLRPETVSVNADSTLRLPSIFDSDSTGSANGAPPSVCNIPGLSMTYQKFMAEGEKAYPFYCYIASTPITEGLKADAFKAAIEAEVAKSGAAGGKFAPVTVNTPSGQSVTWDLLSVTSMQNFAGKPPAPEISMEGRFDLYFKSSGSNFILIGWRAPKAAAAANKFFDDVKFSMGSAVVKESQPAAPPAGGPPGAGS